MSKEMQNSRRNFMKTSAISATALGVGFVAASEPIMAAAIETDFKGLKVGEQMIPVTVSVGVASLQSEQEETLDGLLKRADEALYAAKNGGRNRVVVSQENSTLALFQRARNA